jgi:hypothetical protein
MGYSRRDFCCKVKIERKESYPMGPDWGDVPVPERKQSLRWLRTNLPLILSFFGLAVSTTSVLLTFENTRTAQRAYIGVELKVDKPEELGNVLRDLRHRPAPTNLELTITNLGSTPAYKVTPVFYALRDEVIDAFAGPNSPPVVVDLSPKQSIPIYGTLQVLDSARLRALLVTAGAKRVIWGHVAYTDVFKARHADNVCYSIFVSPVDTVQMGNCLSDDNVPPKSSP